MRNPIIKREMQTSLRSWKLFYVVCAYVAFLLLVAYLFLETMVSQTVYSGFDPKDVIYLYALLSGIQLAFVLLAVPSLTAGSIRGERERPPLDILLTTKMTPFSIVFGKLVAGIGQLLMMIVATLPVYAVLYYFGGISIWHILSTTLYLMVTAVFIGSFSILFSCIYKRTMISMLVVYVLFGLLIFATAGGYLIYLAYINSQASMLNVIATPNPLAYLGCFAFNPGAGFFSLLSVQIGTNPILSWFGYAGAMPALPLPTWVINVVAELVLSVGILALAAKKINPLKRK